jgi:hypothetical protein
LPILGGGVANLLARRTKKGTGGKDEFATLARKKMEPASEKKIGFYLWSFFFSKQKTKKISRT